MKISLRKNIRALQEIAKVACDAGKVHPEIHALKLQEAQRHLSGDLSDYIIAESKIRKTDAGDLARSIVNNHKSRKLNPILSDELKRQKRVAEIRGITDANELEKIALENPISQ